MAEYEDTRLFVQEEEWIQPEDLEELKRRRKRAGCDTESVTEIPNPSNIAGAIGVIGAIGGIAAVAAVAAPVAPPLPPPPPPPPVVLPPVVTLAVVAGLAPLGAIQPGEVGGGAIPTPAIAAAAQFRGLVPPPDTVPVSYFPPFVRGTTTFRAGAVLFTESDEVSMMVAEAQNLFDANRRRQAHRRYRRGVRREPYIPHESPIVRLKNTVLDKVGRAVSNFKEFKSSIKRKIKTKLFGQPEVTESPFTSTLPPIQMNITIPRLYGARVRYEIVNEPCILGVTCDAEGNALLPGFNSTNQELAAVFMNLSPEERERVFRIAEDSYVPPARNPDFDFSETENSTFSGPTVNNDNGQSGFEGQQPGTQQQNFASSSTIAQQANTFAGTGFGNSNVHRFATSQSAQPSSPHPTFTSGSLDPNQPNPFLSRPITQNFVPIYNTFEEKRQQGAYSSSFYADFSEDYSGFQPDFTDTLELPPLAEPRLDSGSQTDPDSGLQRQDKAQKGHFNKEEYEAVYFGPSPFVEDFEYPSAEFRQDVHWKPVRLQGRSSRWKRQEQTVSGDMECRLEVDEDTPACLALLDNRL